MMPKEGVYSMTRIDKQIFCMLLKEFYEKNMLVNYIGYEQNIKLIEKWTGIKLQPNRSEVQNLQHGDSFLVMKLKYRLPTTSLKSNHNFQNNLSENDFEFFSVKYEK